MLINGDKLKRQRVLKKKTVDLMKINRVGSTYSRKNQGFGYGFAIEYDEFSDEKEKAREYSIDLRVNKDSKDYSPKGVAAARDEKKGLLII